MAILIQISFPLCEAVDVPSKQTQLAVVLMTASYSMVRTTVLGEGDEVIVEDWVFGTCSEDVPQSNESCLSPLSVEPIVFSMPSDFCAGQKEVGVDSSRGQELYSKWFQSRFNEFDDFLGTSLNGLEEQATNFLLAVGAKLQQRAVAEKDQLKMKSSGVKGRRELRGLFSSINYGSTSTRRSGKVRDKALLVSQ